MRFNYFFIARILNSGEVLNIDEEDGEITHRSDQLSQGGGGEKEKENIQRVIKKKTFPLFKISVISKDD